MVVLKEINRWRAQRNLGEEGGAEEKKGKTERLMA